MVRVRLRCVFRVLALAVQRILLHCGFQQASLAVDQRNAHAESAKINSGDDRHQRTPFCGRPAERIPGEINRKVSETESAKGQKTKGRPICCLSRWR